MAESTKTNQEQKVETGFDLFHWANLVEQYKKEFDVELFLINKHFTPFRLNLDSKLDSQTRVIFLHELINYINKGAETGLSVHQFELEDKTKDVVLTTTTQKVERASYLQDFLLNRQNEIVDFNQDEHEFRLMRAIVFRFSLKGDKDEIKPFYIIKQISASQAVFGNAAWQINGSKIESFANDVSLKLPLDNQIMITDGQIFVFNQSKFERLFSYDYKKQLIAEEKIKQIESKFRLSFPEGITIQNLVKERKKTLAKIQKLELTTMTQEELIDYADEMELELMSDENGAIIILDGSDLDIFIGLLNEDYMLSTVTNKRYEITGKKVLNEPTGEAPRG